VQATLVTQALGQCGRSAQVVVDTCPSEEAFQAFSSSAFPALRARHGLPDPECLEDFLVYSAFVDGERRPEKAR
jgi:hypothetical protein